MTPAACRASRTANRRHQLGTALTRKLPRAQARPPPIPAPARAQAPLPSADRHDAAAGRDAPPPPAVFQQTLLAQAHEQGVQRPRSQASLLREILSVPPASGTVQKG